MTILVRHQPRGLPVAITVDGAARRFFERGKDLSSSSGATCST